MNINSNTLKMTVVFASGFIIGGLTSALVVKNQHRKEIESLINELRPNDSNEEKRDEETMNVEDDSNIEATTLYNDEGEKMDVIHYSEIAKKYDSLSEKQDLSNSSKQKNNSAPHIINLEQFSEENDDYEKITLYYYRDDKVLTDADAEGVADIKNTIGHNIINSLGSEIENTVYVRNDRISTDYEIVLLKQNYAETQKGYN